ncbi:MAG: hypothetical protein BAJALOKI1v1_1300001 [Promethearchaeota archaeon]|nr:MAG: hypothetical protein BAJALOKI1v1_1300001 [Candidatus Lokiarchaeota archaeon]
MQSYKSSGISPINPTGVLIDLLWDKSEFFGLIARSLLLARVSFSTSV